MGKKVLEKHVWLGFGLVVTVVLLAFRHLLQPALFRTHDSLFHAARLANYYLALQQGQFPPRWAPNLNHGFGYPVFSFIYPLPYFVGTLFFIVTDSIEQSLNLYTLLGVFLMASGWYFLSWHKTKSTLASIATSLFLVSAPYFFLTIFVRGAIAETFFIGLIPWVILLIEASVWLFKAWWGRLLTIIMLAVLILAHQVSLVVAVPLFMAYVFLYWWNKKQIIVEWMVLSLTAAMLTAWFWYPLFTEMSLTVVADHSTFQVDQLEFIPLTALVWEKWAYGGFSEGVQDEGFSRMIGPVHLLVALASIIVFFARSKKGSARFLFWILVLSMTFGLMLPYSQLLWKILWPLRLLQFPYRLLWVSLTAIGMIWLSAYHYFPNTSKKIIAVLLVLSSLASFWFWAKPVATFQEETYYWLEYSQTGDAYQEMMPVRFDSGKNVTITDQIAVWPMNLDQQLDLLPNEEKADFVKELVIPQSELRLHNLVWNGSQSSYQIEMPKAGYVLHKTAYFPGWQVWVNEQLVSPVIDHQFFTGRILIFLPEGTHSVETKFTNLTGPRQFGLAISILGLGFALFELFVWFEKKD